MQKIITHLAVLLGLLIVGLLAAYFMDMLQGNYKTLLLFAVAILLIMEVQFVRFVFNPKCFDKAYHRQKWQEYKKFAPRRKAVAPDFDPESGAMLSSAVKPDGKSRLAPDNLTNSDSLASLAAPDNLASLKAWESSLTTLWQGKENISFNYASRNGVKKECALAVESVLLDDCRSFYLRGNCHFCQEPRTYNVDFIQGQLNCDGKKLEIYDFFMQRLGISEAQVFFLDVKNTHA